MYAKEKQKDILTHQEYCYYYRSLNKEQRDIVDFHREWCKKTVILLKKNQPVKPYHLFLSGPGGVGKSYVIKMIHTDTIRYMRSISGISTNDITAMLTATTGVAAFNIEGITIHSGFHLYDSMAQGKSKRATAQKNVYYPLSCDTRNSLRVKYENLMVIIIDEISMLSADDLYKLHMRLQEIMNISTNNAIFGNVTIIAVGDLYQLPAIGTKIYDIPGRFSCEDIRRLYGSLWSEHFKLHELTTVVRQKDLIFSELLNRLRTADMNEDDILILKTRITQLDNPNHYKEALHVYGTNAEADEYNKLMVNDLSSCVVSIYAKDINKTQPSVQLPEKISDRLLKLPRRATGNLCSHLEICIGAMVKLTCNIDVADGLCNGARGMVKDIIYTGTEITNIMVKFEHESVGEKMRSLSPFSTSHPESVPIFKHSNFFYHNAICISRKQFPIVLAFATTIHAVQGLTVDRIVCDMKTVRQPGQVYVALSRVKTLEGLQILNFNPTAIRKDKNAEKEMMRLRSKNILNNNCVNISYDHFSIAYINIRGLLCHMKDLSDYEIFQKSDIVTFTETHLQNENNIYQSQFNWGERDIFRSDRSSGVKGGVMTIVKKEYNSNIINVKTKFTECTLIYVPMYKLYILTVYRQVTKSNIDNFTSELNNIICNNFGLLDNIVIIGDFNQELGGSISKFMLEKGFNYLNMDATTDYGSKIDHVYIKGTFEVRAIIKNTYFSDHETIHLSLFNFM